MAGKSLPPSGGGFDPKLKALLDKLSERVDVLSDHRGDPLDRALTPRDLIDLGLARRLGRVAQRLVSGGNLVATTGPGSQSTPPAPTGFTVTGGLEHIFLEWDNSRQAYGNHGYTAIYRNTVDNLANAIEVAQTSSSFNHADLDVSYGVNYYYWIRFVSTSNVMGPPNSPVGTLGKLSEDPTELLERLSGEIASTHLAEELRTQIEDIAAAIETLEAVYVDTVNAAESAAAAVAAAAEALGARADAVQARTDAIAAETSALNAKNIAIVEAGNALTKASEAAASAITATTAGAIATSKAAEAVTSATSSAGSAASAQSSAELATTAATTAGDSASASATSASSAFSSATSAGTAAGAANTSKLAAETALAGAQAAESSSVSAKNDAQSAASSASSSAALAVNAKNDASGFASAAATSEANAFTHASNAGTSAGAANSAKLDAQTALSGAQAAQSAAVTAKNDAESSASAANTSSSLATTAKNSAEAAASAAATSESNAFSSASSAGTSAGAANTAKLSAETAAGNASTYATNAATSETNAAGSASSASSSATLAASSATSAGNSASAAAGHASTATTKATEATTSASAADTARVSAESARDSAIGSASAAATSASTASTQASNAATSASSANTSAATATTKAAEALTYRNQAATSESNAAGYAAASAIDYTAITARLNNVGGVTLEQKFIAQANSIDGLYGQYTLKIDVNGRVSGFGLASTNTASTFIINADKFAIGRPGHMTEDIYPFIVDTADGNRVVMDAAFIKNATINDAQVGNINVTKITGITASFIIGKFTTAWIDAAYIVDAGITTAKIQDASITTAKIASVIQSSNYNPGVDGWKIEKSGAAEFNGVVISRPNVVADDTLVVNSVRFYRGSIGGAPADWLQKIPGMTYVETSPGVWALTENIAYADMGNYYTEFLIDTGWIHDGDISDISSASFSARANVLSTYATFGSAPSAGTFIYHLSTECSVEMRTPFVATGGSPSSGTPSRRVFIRLKVNVSDIHGSTSSIRIDSIAWALHRLT